MEPSALISSLQAQTAAQNGAATSKSKLNQDFDTFLTLLTAQLKNQDPLEPLDTNEFTQQLVQYSSVEQSIETNKNLETLINMQKTGAGNTAVGYMGRQVTALGDTTTLANGTASWSYAFERNADAVSITVSDSSGRTVYSTTGNKAAGVHTFTWDGRDSSGRPLPDGAYSISVAARDDKKAAIPVATGIDGVVTGVTLAGDEPLLAINGVTVRLSDILSISAPRAAGS